MIDDSADIEESKDVPEKLESLGQQIAKQGKRIEEPKNTINFKAAVSKFKSKNELYQTLCVRGKHHFNPLSVCDYATG